MDTDQFEIAKRHFFEGLQLLEANNLQAAEMQFARSLQILPGRVSTLNNLSAIKLKLKQFAEAEGFAREAIALEDKSPEAWSNLGIALTARNLHEDALQACERALSCNSACAKAWLAKAKTLLELERYDEALLACDETLKLEPDKYETLYTKSLILKGLERADEAKKIYLKSFEMRVAASPVFIAERRETQKADALILNQNPDLDGSLQSFETLQRFCKNFPGQLGERLHEDFHFTYVFVGDAARLSSRQRIPQPDFIINNNVNGEAILSAGDLPALTGLIDGFGVPVVNHPAHAVRTTRDVSAQSLDNLPGVIVPRTMRFSTIGKTREELMREIEEHYDYPLITRTLTSQMGKGMTKVDSPEEMRAVLATDFPEKFFVTEFVDSRNGSELFRKIRAAIVDDEIVVARVDYHTHWNVHGRKNIKRVPFYLANLHLLEEEKRICIAPEAELGRAAMQSLRAIRKKNPLDIFGIDFDVDADGRIVFYEANATMNLFSTACKEVPNPKEADESLKLAFQRYFNSLVAPR